MEESFPRGKVRREKDTSAPRSGAASFKGASRDRLFGSGAGGGGKSDGDDDAGAVGDSAGSKKGPRPRSSSGGREGLSKKPSAAALDRYFEPKAVLKDAPTTNRADELSFKVRVPLALACEQYQGLRWR